MSATTLELPRAAAKHPARYLLHPLRPIARLLIKLRLGVRLHGLEHVPATGAVIFASNHVGVADGPLLAIYSPRPVHALTKIEMFQHWFLGPFLLAAGQIPLDRFRTDPAAVKSCLRVLHDGGAVGIFPEGARGAGEFERIHPGAAYLALVSGAPIIPVVQFGTREPGAGNNALPRRGGVIDIVYGAPYTIAATPWPRTQEQVRHESVLLNQYLFAQLAEAKALTGRELPGPTPEPEADPGPTTGVTDQGAS